MPTLTDLTPAEIQVGMTIAKAIHDSLKTDPVRYKQFLANIAQREQSKNEATKPVAS